MHANGKARRIGERIERKMEADKTKEKVLKACLASCK